MTTPLIFEPATTLAKKIQAHELTSEQVTQAYLNQIKQHNPTINAVVGLRPEADILEEAREKDRQLATGNTEGPLHGLPLTVKDSFDVTGLISSNGSPLTKNNVAKEDAALIKRLKKAGAIIMGKTNIALYAIDWQCDNKWFGRTNNPYDITRSPGGSSGGSSAALAAGFTPLELGTDSGGSIRVPAHFCGVCGLRTTEGSLPMRGNMQNPGQLRGGRYMVNNGPMARNVDDLLLMMEVLRPSQQEFAEIAPVGFRQFTLAEGKPLRLAFSGTLGNRALDQEYKAVFDTFIAKLQQTEHALTEDAPSLDHDQLVKTWGHVLGFEVAATLKIPLRRWLSHALVYNMHKDGLWASAMGKGAMGKAHIYAKALQQKDDVSDEFTRFFQHYDAWLTPVCAIPAYKHQKPGKPFTINGQKVPYTRAFTPYAFATSVPGQPVATIPIGTTASGLPVGININGQRWHDYKVLQVAKLLEQHTPGFQVPPMLQ